MGHRVGALDLDLRQRSFGRYLENRAAFARAQGLTCRHRPAGLPAGGRERRPRRTRGASDDLRLHAALRRWSPAISS
jgi:hypothetical protein